MQHPLSTCWNGRQSSRELVWKVGWTWGESKPVFQSTRWWWGWVTLMADLPGAGQLWRLVFWEQGCFDGWSSRIRAALNSYCFIAPMKTSIENAELIRKGAIKGCDGCAHSSVISDGPDAFPHASGAELYLTFSLIGSLFLFGTPDALLQVGPG